MDLILDNLENDLDDECDSFQLDNKGVINTKVSTTRYIELFNKCNQKQPQIPPSLINDLRPTICMQPPWAKFTGSLNL